MDKDELRGRRKALDLTQEGLAQELGVTPTTVARWERDEVPIPGYLELALDGLELKMKGTKRKKGGKTNARIA
jgi:transcriptional regulator with XRE-family HTH domain